MPLDETMLEELGLTPRWVRRAAGETGARGDALSPPRLAGTDGDAPAGAGIDVGAGRFAPEKTSAVMTRAASEAGRDMEGGTYPVERFARLGTSPVGFAHDGDDASLRAGMFVHDDAMLPSTVSADGGAASLPHASAGDDRAALLPTASAADRAAPLPRASAVERAMSLPVASPTDGAASLPAASTNDDAMLSSSSSSSLPLSPAPANDAAIPSQPAPTSPRDNATPPLAASSSSSSPGSDSRQPASPASNSSSVAAPDWDALAECVAACTRCKLCEKRTKTVFGVGDRQADWLLVGEAPGENEDRIGEPFVGQAGRLLDNMLRALALARGQNVYIANVIKCRPPGNRNPEPDEVARCEPYLQRQVALVKPKIIVALGRFAAQSLLKTQASIASLRGRVHRYEGVPVIVTYHPAYLLRSLHDKSRAWTDLCLARKTWRAAADAGDDSGG